MGRTCTRPSSPNARRPDEVQLAVGPAWQVLVGDGPDLGRSRSRCPAIRRSAGTDEELEADERRDRVARQTEDRGAGSRRASRRRGAWRAGWPPASSASSRRSGSRARPSRSQGRRRSRPRWPRGRRTCRPGRDGRLDRRLVVADDAEVDGLVAVVGAARRAGRDGWRRGSCPAPRSRPAVDELVAGREDADPGTSVDARARLGPRLASTPTWPALSTSRAPKTCCAASDVLPGAPHELPGPPPPPRSTTIDPPSSVRVRSTMHTASAPCGNGAPVMMRIASPGPTEVRGRAGHHGTRPPQADRGGAVSAARTA